MEKDLKRYNIFRVLLAYLVGGSILNGFSTGNSGILAGCWPCHCEKLLVV